MSKNIEIRYIIEIPNSKLIEFYVKDPIYIPKDGEIVNFNTDIIESEEERKRLDKFIKNECLIAHVFSLSYEKDGIEVLIIDLWPEDQYKRHNKTRKNTLYI